MYLPINQARGKTLLSVLTEMVNGKWLPILWSAWKRQHSISFVYRSYHLPMPDPSPSKELSREILRTSYQQSWPSNNLHWARTPHHQPTPNQRPQLLVTTLYKLQCTVRH